MAKSNPPVFCKPGSSYVRMYMPRLAIADLHFASPGA